MRWVSLVGWAPHSNIARLTDIELAGTCAEEDVQVHDKGVEVLGSFGYGSSLLGAEPVPLTVVDPLSHHHIKKKPQLLLLGPDFPEVSGPRPRGSDPRNERATTKKPQRLLRLSLPGLDLNQRPHD